MKTVADPERLLKAGATAYKAGEFKKAIASLQPLLQDRSYRLKAGMGLVKVYISQHEWDSAYQLCEKMAQSSQPSVQRWAKETLAKIERKRAETATTSSASSRSHRDLANGPTKTLSGFVPLSANEANSALPLQNASPAKKPISRKPISRKPASKKPISKKPVKVNSSWQKPPTEDRNRSAKAAIPEPKTESKRETRSIFHYARLNSELDNVGVQTEDSISHPPSAVDGSSAKKQTEWAYAGRLQKGRSLGKIRTGKRWISQIAGAAGVYFMARYLLSSAISSLNSCLSFLSNLPLLRWIQPLPAFDLSWPLLAFLGLVAIASPWLWDALLGAIANRQSFSLNALRSFSIEAATVISQKCRQRRWPLPKLWKLSTDMPLIFSYGWLPRTARLVVSDGLIAQLQEDELATLIAYEMAQWKSLYWPVLSACGLILQLLHQIYWQLALWGNRQNRPLNIAAGIVSTLSYGVFWLLRMPLLWMTRMRTYYSDRAACELTGNPNGLIRALAKVSFGLARAVDDQGYTPAQIESAELLLPVSPDLARYQLYGRYPLEELYAWDSLNPLRGWMSLPNAHPPLGDRFALISAYAQHWKLQPELSLPALTQKSRKKRRQESLSKQDWQRLFSQGTPYLSAAIGLALGLALWVLGAVGHWLAWPFLDWMKQDIGLLGCCVLLGAGIGIILRINRFFPDLSFNRPFSTEWPSWLSEPELLPVESIPTHLSGTVLGRPGLANWLGQDLLLKTTDGLIKLHFFSVAGPLGNCLRLGSLPIGQSVQLLGWFRRGNQPWIDIDQMRLNNSVISAAHPIFSLAIALISISLGLWLLLSTS